jgi:hypothetical protein
MTYAFCANSLSRDAPNQAQVPRAVRESPQIRSPNSAAEVPEGGTGTGVMDTGSAN